MSEPQQWAFPEALQPKLQEIQFDLARALDAMVLVRSEIPADGHTASTLGTERGGYGVAIRDDGLVLTIGYLINEASQIWLTSNRGSVVPGYRLAYDQATGFGLIQPLGKLDVTHLARGRAADLKVGDTVFALGHGGLGHALKTQVLEKREFAGSWEYLLDEAIFTTPAHPQWGGAALLDSQGHIVGIGSLLVQQEVNGEAVHANMPSMRWPESPRPCCFGSTTATSAQRTFRSGPSEKPASRASTTPPESVSVRPSHATGIVQPRPRTVSVSASWRMSWKSGSSPWRRGHSRMTVSS